MSLLAVIFVFSILVFIHELGHFLAAKWMGVRVERFSIGFPPRVFGKKIGDTDYCISAIPFGGYVKMSGMLDESLDTTTTGADYEFNSKPAWKKFIIMIAGVVMNFLLAIVVLTFYNYSKGEVVYPYTKVGIVGEAGISSKIGFQEGDKILSVNGKRVLSWNQIQNEYINNLNSDITFMVERDGQPKNLISKKEWFQEKNSEQLDLFPELPNKIGLVLEGKPAEKIGLQTGDQITNLAGIAVSNWIELTEVIREHPNDSISIEWIRAGKSYASVICPEAATETDTANNVITVGKIGIGHYYEHNPISFLTATSKGFTGTIDMIALNTQALWWVISGTKSAKEIIGGPIMIAKLAGDAASAGWDQLWYLIAALSAVLAFFNILPIPALDGGHILILLIEAIKGKPLTIKTRLAIQQVGMAILFTFIIFIMYVDLKRLLF